MLQGLEPLNHFETLWKICSATAIILRVLPVISSKTYGQWQQTGKESRKLCRSLASAEPRDLVGKLRLDGVEAVRDASLHV